MVVVKQTSDFPEAWFTVTVMSDSTTFHDVLVSQSYYEKLTQSKIDPTDLVRLSFRYLLTKEKNTAILSTFHLDEISRFFPEFEKEIRII